MNKAHVEFNSKGGVGNKQVNNQNRFPGLN